MYGAGWGLVISYERWMICRNKDALKNCVNKDFTI